MSLLLRLCMALLMGFLLALVGRAEPAPDYSIGSIVAKESAEGTYERMEFVVPVRGPTLNPFRSAEMALDAEVTTPLGKVLRVPGFFSQDFRLEDHGGVPVDNSSAWRIRFSGDEVGEYRFKVVLRIRGAQAATAAGPAFTLKKSSNHGMIRVSRKSPRYLEFDDGVSYFAIGQNVCFTTDIAKAIPNVRMQCKTLPWDEAYRRWFEKMGQNGANWARIWMRPNFCLESGQPWQWSLENAWRLDQVVDLARQNGLYLCLCFNSERSAEGNCFKGRWEGFRAANTAWGPLLKSHQKNFSSFGELEAAREMYRDKIRYIVARWGCSPNVFCWELWNEIECIEANAMTPWSKDMTAYIRQVDPWRHLIKSSAHYPGSQELWSPDFGDLNDVHAYFGWSGDELPKNLGSFLPQFASAVRARGRPFLIGETGIAREAETKYGLGGNLQDRDTTCLSMHEGLWAGLFSGAAGTGMPWWWDEHVDLRDGYPRFRAIANFVKDISFNDEAFVYQDKPSLSAPQLKVFELVGRHTRLLWLRHPQLSWYNEAVEKKPRVPVRDAKLTLSDVQPGDYVVEIWNTERGEIIEIQNLRTKATTLDISLKDVESELAIKVREKKS